MEKKLGLRKDNIQRRVKSLHEKGILGTPTIILDAKKCGFEGIIDFFIKTVPGIEDPANLQEKLAKLPHFIFIAKTTGAHNLYVSSFFKDINDLRDTIETIKREEQILTLEMVIYFKDTSDPLMMPFLENRPENSILFKTRSKIEPTR